jgi:SAM-dependent methyltransferase
MIDLERYDFLDLGASTGGSIRFCQQRFGAACGLGIDISSGKVESAVASGIEATVADATELGIVDEVRFVSMMDFLEHLPDLNAVERTIASAARAATDFLFIRNPSFEGEEYLRGLGLRQYWWHWRGHPVHPQVADFCRIFDRLGLRQYMIRYELPIEDSSHETIVSHETPIDQGAFDPATHPPKRSVTFDRPLWRYQDIYVALRPFDPPAWEEITGRG